MARLATARRLPGAGPTAARPALAPISSAAGDAQAAAGAAAAAAGAGEVVVAAAGWRAAGAWPGAGARPGADARSGAGRRAALQRSGPARGQTPPSASTFRPSSAAARPAARSRASETGDAGFCMFRLLRRWRRTADRQSDRSMRSPCAPPWACGCVSDPTWIVRLRDIRRAAGWPASPASARCGPAAAAAARVPARSRRVCDALEAGAGQQRGAPLGLVVAMLQQQPAAGQQVRRRRRRSMRVSAARPSPPGVSAARGSCRSAGRCGSSAAM